MTVRSAEPDWDALKALEGDLIKEFASEGVRHVEYVVAFVEPFNFWLPADRGPRVRRIMVLSPEVKRRLSAG